MENSSYHSRYSLYRNPLGENQPPYPSTMAPTVGKYGVPLASAGNLQQALVHGTLLYGAELTWGGSRTAEEAQGLTSRLGRSSLGARRKTSLGIVTAESALPPARALLDHRQARFALRLMARPRGGGGQEILERRNGLTARIKERCGLGRRETVEAQSWEEFRALKGSVLVEGKEEDLRAAGEWQDRSCTVWTDGPWLESWVVGAVVASGDSGRWARKGTHLGKNKEGFDAEVFAILRAAGLLNERSKSGRDYTIFSDSQAAILIQHHRCRPAQALEEAVIAVTDGLDRRGCTLTTQWTPSHEEVEDNEQADGMTRLAAEEEGESRTGVPPGGQPLPPHEEDNRDAFRGYQRFDTRPCGTKALIQAPPLGEAPKGASQGEEGTGGKVLPATVVARSNGRAPGADRTGIQRSTLVVREWKETDEVPSLR